MDMNHVISGLTLLAMTTISPGCGQAPERSIEPLPDDASTYTPPDVQPEPRDLTQSDIERMMDELSNWGRWGAEDQLGAANLITPEKRLEEIALVTSSTRDRCTTGYHKTASRQKAALTPRL